MSEENKLPTYPSQDMAYFKSHLLKNKRAIQTIFNDEQEANRFMLGVFNVVQQNNNVAKCTIESICNAAVTSAVLNVPLDARGYGYLIPYKDKAQFQLSYKGYVHIAKRDPEVDNIISHVVYEGDTFSFDIGNNTVSHMPNLDGQFYGDKDHVKYVYAIARFKANSGRLPYFEVMTKKQIDEIRASSQAGGEMDKWGNPTIWEKHYLEMARKTAIKRLLKHAQLGNTIHIDAVDNAYDNNQVINVTPDNELVVESPDTKRADEIITLYESCESIIDLQNALNDNAEFIQEMAEYNVKESKRIESVRRKKWRKLQYDNCYYSYETCEDVEELRNVEESNKSVIDKLSNKEKEQLGEYYQEKMAELQNRELDNQIPT